MEDERPSIEDIMLAWKQKYGVNRTSERGKNYTEISRHDREEHLHYLHATLLDYSYTAKDMTRPNICYFLAELCWSDEIQKLSNTIVEKKRKEEIKTWKGIVLQNQITFSEKAPAKKVEEFFPVQPKESEEELPTLEEALKPVKYVQNDPKYNTANLPPIQIDEGFIAELNAIKTSLRGTNE